MRLAVLSAVLLVPALVAQRPNAILVDTTLDQLFSVDLNTGAATFLVAISNPTVLATAADLAWRPDTQELWTIDLSGGEIGTIDLTTGTFTQVALSGQNGWQGMAWDPTTQKFYLANQNYSTYVFDPVTGVTSLLGPTGQGLGTALTVDSAGTLYGIGFSSGVLHTIDKVTGATVNVSTTTPTNMQGMAFAPDGTLYAVNTTTDALYRIDPASGNTTLIGTHNVGNTFAKGFCILGSAACPDGAGIRRNMQRTGNAALGQTFSLNAEQGPIPLPMFLFLGTSSTMIGTTPLPVNLGPFGAPGCFIYQSSDSSTFTVTGIPIPFAVPNNNAYLGFRLFSQALVLDLNPGANALGMVTTDMLPIVVQ